MSPRKSDSGVSQLDEEEEEQLLTISIQLPPLESIFDLSPDSKWRKKDRRKLHERKSRARSRSEGSYLCCCYCLRLIPKHSKKKNEKGSEELAAVKRSREIKGQRAIHATCDEELAHSAHLYHYQLKKKQLLEQEANQSFLDEDEEDGDVVLLNQRIKSRGVGGLLTGGRGGGGGGRSGSGGSLSDDSGKSSPSGSITLHHKKHSGPNGVGGGSSHETVAFVAVNGGTAVGGGGTADGGGGGVESNDITTVYECNGLAASNDFEEIEVRNPLFQHDISNDTTNENETAEQSPSPPPQVNHRNFSGLYYYQNESSNLKEQQIFEQSMHTKGVSSASAVNGDGSLVQQQQHKENGHSQVTARQNSDLVVMEMRSENGDL